MKTLDQLLVLSDESIRRWSKGVDIAMQQSNATLLASNLGHGLRAYLLKGLICWRTGAGDPRPIFCDCQAFVHDGLVAWNLLKGDIEIRNEVLPLEKSMFITYLLDQEGKSIDIDPRNYPDRQLEAMLGRGLYDEWDDSRWETAIAKLGKLKGASLAADTYAVYRQILLGHSNEGIEGLVSKAIDNFEKRKNNRFYSNGESTGGGGEFNSITVDYILAAILKKRRISIANVHHWKW